MKKPFSSNISERKFLLLISFLCLGLFAPFSGKHFAHDSPMTIHVAHQILLNPLNPPLGELGKYLLFWNHTDLPESSVYYITPHPLLIPLIISPFLGLFGEESHIISWLMFPFYLSSVLFFYGCAKTLRMPFIRLSTLLFSICPVVFVNSLDVMLDIPLTAFILGAFYFLFRSDSKIHASLSGLLFTFGMLTKFTAGPFLICAVFYFISLRRWKQMVCFFIPFVILYGAWSIQNLFFYHKLQVLSNGHMRYLWGDLRYRFERQISYIGGTIIFPGIVAVTALLKARFRNFFLILFLAASIWSTLLIIHLGYSISSASFFALSCSAGLFIVTTAILPALQEGNVKAKTLGIFLLLEIVGGLFLTLYASRYILPFLLPIFLGLATFIRKNFKLETGRKILTISIISSFVISILLSISDMKLAAIPQKLCLELKKYEPDKIRFAGRMGYLYYLNRAGFKYLTRGENPKDDQYIIQKYRGKDDAYLLEYPGKIFTPVDTFSYNLFPFSTVENRAGFHGDDRLPYALLVKNAADIYILYKVSSATSFNHFTAR